MGVESGFGGIREDGTDYYGGAIYGIGRGWVVREFMVQTMLILFSGLWLFWLLLRIGVRFE